MGRKAQGDRPVVVSAGVVIHPQHTRRVLPEADVRELVEELLVVRQPQPSIPHSRSEHMGAQQLP